jgi:hypothetical protein
MKKPFAAPILLALAAVAVSAQGLSAQVSVDAEVATAVVDRMPEGGGMQFSDDVGELFVWTRVTGAENSTLTHVWMHDGNEWPVSLAIGGSPWRTWSSKVIQPEWTGEWSVEIRDANGNVIETLMFTVG